MATPTREDLRSTIADILATIEKKRTLINPEILDQMDKLTPLAAGMNASTIKAAALACGITTEVNLPAMITLVHTLVEHEKRMTHEIYDMEIRVLRGLLDYPELLEKITDLGRI